MRLDTDYIKHLTKDEISLLLGIESQMDTYDLVPTKNLEKYVRPSALQRMLRDFGKKSIVHHEGRPFDSYRLTYHGIDALALYNLKKNKSLVTIGMKMGCGKESDLYFAETGNNNEEVVLKLHRLGRVSFRGVKNKRDYTNGVTTNLNWLKISSLSCKTEFNYMKLLGDYKFRVPKVYDFNRHAIVMGAIRGRTLNKIKAGDLDSPEKVLDECLNIITRLASIGLIHADFNEFNLIIVDTREEGTVHGYVETEEDMDTDDMNNHYEKVVMIDFPQMVEVTHLNAQEMFERDVNGICNFFESRFGMIVPNKPEFEDICEPVVAEIKKYDKDVKMQQRRERKQLKKKLLNEGVESN